MVGVTPSAAHALARPVLVPLAQDLNQNKVTPGLLGFVVFAVMALGLWALMKNMGKHMKKIDFEEQPADEPRRADARAEVRADAGRDTGGDARS
jgi:hypothetical protein